MATKILAIGVGEVLKKVCSIAADEIGVAWGVKGELQRLQRKLSMIQSVMNDAEKRQAGNDLVKQWLQRLKGIAYDAEDVLDDFKSELFRRKMEMQTRKSKVRNFFSLTNPIAFRFKTAHKIKAVNESLVKLKVEGDTFGFRKENNSQQHNTVGEQRQVTTSCVNTSTIVGRDYEKRSVVDQLLKSSDQDHVVIPVLPIVGVGGLGKTTLAQLVYGDDEIQKSFDIRIWICVSDVFDVQRILREIIEFITNSKCDLSNTDVMANQIKEKTRGKRFLLVLDDVWNDERDKWETFKNLLDGACVPGSKVIVTTRSEKVSSLVGTLDTHHLQKLSPEASWRLFEQLAFRGGRAPENSNVVEIGKDIARKCGGLPLALMHLGCLMLDKKHEHEWEHIRDSKIWLLPEADKLMKILKLSYDCLSPPLQRCFSYCAMFPKDAVIHKQMLVQLWIAERYLEQPETGSRRSMEHIGDEYWNILMQRSFFQDVKEDEFRCTFKMHDLVHDLACSLAGKEWCFGNLDRNEDAAEIRFMLSGSDLLESLPNINKLRTFRMAERTPCVSIEALNSWFLKLKYVRVLDLQASNFKELPSSVSKLRHLKLFDLSRNPIVQLPDSICSLYNLQTLRLVDCGRLKELPVETRKLIGLRHLEIQGCDNLRDMPRDIGRLSSLQTLSKFVVGKEGSGCSIRELQHLNLGGELVIKGLQNVATKTEAKAANLAKKSNVHTLKLFWEGDEESVDVLEGLQPHSNLRRLVIGCVVSVKIPTWMNVKFLRELVVMEITRWKRCENLPPLGQLPSLRVLKIRGMDCLRCIENEFYGCDDNRDRSQEVGLAFPSLRVLWIWSMRHLQEWVEPAVDSFFPLLEELKIRRCPKLTKTPSRMMFPSLKRLTVHGISSSSVESLSSKVSSLTVLHLTEINDMMSLPQGLLGRNDLLRSLIISYCPELVALPSDELGHLKCLETLQIMNCQGLTSMPDLRCVTSLRILLIEGCQGVISPEGLHYLSLLESLRIGPFREELDVFSLEGIQHMVSLRELTLKGWSNIKSLPEQLRHLTKLRSLGIDSFENLEALPDWLTNLSSLESLRIGPSREELDVFSLEGIQHMVSLRELSLVGWPNIKSLPEQLRHLTKLQVLDIRSFENLEALPDWLTNLSSLEFLYISNNPNLKHLPQGKMSQLKRLRVRHCPLLKERCERGRGEEWEKISHIPYVGING